MAPNDPDLTTFRTAIYIFKNAAPSSPYNYDNLANVHFNNCAHSNWFLLPWHRAYIAYFEWLVQQATGNLSFALPYWDWTRNPSIPQIFTHGSLYDPTRVISPTDQLDPNFVSVAAVKPILKSPDFTVFGSQPAANQTLSPGAGALEATPHNHVHDWIGGHMGTFHSPQDPIFWFHHSNVDRLWAMWNQSFLNPSDPAWLNYNMIFGAPEMPSLTVYPWTISTHALHYIYDNQSYI